MFWVADTRVERHLRIRSFMGREATIGALLAAVDFEWTLRRAIIALGYSPNRIIRETTLKECHGLDGYKLAWRSEVGRRFPQIGRLPELIDDWCFLKKQAFLFRHQVVHGIKGNAGESYASQRRDALLSASEAICDVASKQRVDLYARLPVRPVRGKQ